MTRNWRGEKASGDDADPHNAAGFRTHGKSKDSRDDLPQIVIGLAVTRDGIRVAENATGQTWPVIRRELDRIHLGA